MGHYANCYESEANAEMLQKYADKIASLSKQIERLKAEQTHNEKERELEVWRQAYNVGLAVTNCSYDLIAVANRALADYRKKREEFGL